MNPKSWLLDGHVARLNLPGFSLGFDAERPAEVLMKIAVLVGLGPADGPLLGVTGSIQSAAMDVTDWHVRGDDLIAVYETGQPVRPDRPLLAYDQAGTQATPGSPALICWCPCVPIARLATRRPPGKRSSRGDSGENCDSGPENIFYRRGVVAGLDGPSGRPRPARS